MMFFKYPLRALWDGYRDFVGNFREDLEEPYLDMFTEAHIKAMAKTGSLGDYLGLPTTLVGDFGAGSDMGTPNLSIAGVRGNLFGGSPDFTYLKGIPVVDALSLLQFETVPPVSEVMTFGATYTVPPPGAASNANTVLFLPTISFSFTTDDGPVTNSSNL